MQNKKAATQLAARDKHGKMTFRDGLSELWKNKMLYLMTLPAAVWVFIFCYIPMYGILIAFKDFNFKKGIWGSQWVGLKNFQFLFNYKGVCQPYRYILCWRLHRLRRCDGV